MSTEHAGQKKFVNAVLLWGNTGTGGPMQWQKATVNVDKLTTEFMATDRKNNWARGYYCCLAVMLKAECGEGAHQPIYRELLGKDWINADPEDIATFRAHNLIPKSP